MKIKVTGLQAVERELNAAIKEVNTQSELMLNVMLQAIRAHTMPYVPVDTSALINSMYSGTAMTPTGPSGWLGFGQGGNNVNGTPVSEYAVYVHEGPQKLWQKPTASNRYLAKGVEDFIQEDLQGIISRFSK